MRKLTCLVCKSSLSWTPRHCQVEWSHSIQTIKNTCTIEMSICNHTRTWTQVNSCNDQTPEQHLHHVCLVMMKHHKWKKMKRRQEFQRNQSACTISNLQFKHILIHMKIDQRQSCPQMHMHWFANPKRQSEATRDIQKTHNWFPILKFWQHVVQPQNKQLLFHLWRQLCLQKHFCGMPKLLKQKWKMCIKNTEQHTVCCKTDCATTLQRKLVNLGNKIVAHAKKWCNPCSLQSQFFCCWRSMHRWIHLAERHSDHSWKVTCSIPAEL